MKDRQQRLDMTLRRILVTLTTTAALSLFSAGAVAATPLSAQGQTADPPNCSAQVSGEKPKISAEPDQNVAQQMTSSADDAVRSGVVHTHVAVDDIDLSHPTVLQVKMKDSEFHSVTFPIKGGGASLMSNTTIVLTGAGDVVTYSESVLTRNASNNFQVTSYSDGVLTKDADSGVKYIDDNGIQQQIDQAKTNLKNGSAASAGTPQGGVDEVPAGVGQVASCIAVALGIGSVPAMVIAGACGGSCAGAATGVGAGICAACIGGIATLGSAEVIAVATCFGYM